MTEEYPICLQCDVPRPRPRLRLVCFPHAGGTASFYRGWGDHLPEAEVLAVRYPGRAERIAEPPPADLPLLAREIAGGLANTANDVPLVLFGHSMGAAVALETARCLESRGVRPVHLVASGSRDAEVPDSLDPPDEDHDSIMRTLVELGGTDPELAADPDFRELVIPYVLGDGRMFHAYAHRPEPILRCPVTTIVGDADPDADRRPWSTLTSGGFAERVVPGDHFYLRDHPPYALLRDAFDPPGPG